MTNPRQSALFRRPDARDLIRLAGGRRIVIVAPHPDDETLGCGLLIARAARAGVPLAVVALTDGQASHPASKRWPAPALGRLRRAEMRRAMARLGAGASRCVFLRWPDGDVGDQGRVSTLRRTLQSLQPGLVLAASPDDHHQDHKAGWALTRAALRGSGVPLVAYAVWSRTGDPGPAARDPGLAAKCWAIAAHRSQTSDYISDDPDGFRLSASILSTLAAQVERFAVVLYTKRRCLAGLQPRFQPGVRSVHQVAQEQLSDPG